MKELFEDGEGMNKDLFEYLSSMFDPKKNLELLRLAEIEAEIKKVQSEE